MLSLLFGEHGTRFPDFHSVSATRGITLPHLDLRIDLNDQDVVWVSEIIQRAQRSCITCPAGYSLHAIEVLPALFDFHFLTPLVVVFVEYFLPNVHPVTDDLLGDVLR